MADQLPAAAYQAALAASSGSVPPGSVEVRGYDFNQGIDYHKLLQSYKTTGFQASNFGLAVEEINKMVCILLKIIINELKKAFNEMAS